MSVEARGNVLSAAAFLYGMAAEELDPAILAEDDPRTPVSILLRAVKR